MRSSVERQGYGGIHRGKPQEAMRKKKKERSFLELGVQGDQISLVTWGHKFCLLTV